MAFDAETPPHTNHTTTQSNTHTHPPPPPPGHPHTQESPEADSSFASQENPENVAGPWALMYFTWLTPLVTKGYRTPLTESDLWKLHFSDDPIELQVGVCVCVCWWWLWGGVVWVWV